MTRGYTLEEIELAEQRADTFMLGVAHTNHNVNGEGVFQPTGDYTEWANKLWNKRMQIELELL